MTIALLLGTAFVAGFCCHVVYAAIRRAHVDYTRPLPLDVRTAQVRMRSLQLGAEAGVLTGPEEAELTRFILKRTSPTANQELQERVALQRQSRRNSP